MDILLPGVIEDRLQDLADKESDSKLVMYLTAIFMIYTRWTDPTTAKG